MSTRDEGLLTEKQEDDLKRMIQWLFISLILYATSISLKNMDLFPQIQTIFWKLGHQTIASFIGYWIDRTAFSSHRIKADSEPLLQIRRAIVMGAAMIAVALSM